MADSVTVRVEGLSELGEAMRDLAFEVQDKLSRRATRAAAKVIERNAKGLAPVDTGNLRDAVGVRRDRKNSYPGYEVMAVGVFSKKKLGKDSPAYYWKFQEFGTVKMAAHSFLRKGYDEEKGDAAEVMGNTLGDGIERKTKSYK